MVVVAEGAKGLPPVTVNQREAVNQLKAIESVDYLILLDENGKEHSSIEFSQFLQQRMNQGIRHLAFMVGGAYGFDEEIRKRANYQLSLSRMTFPHQLIRLLFMEQLYRGFTILRNEPYHHA
jgi:23S rRNA (pseudouridine1915-N3)-methyltransferase